MSIEVIARCNRCNRTIQMNKDYIRSLPLGWRLHRSGSTLLDLSVEFCLCDVCQGKHEAWMTFPKDRQAVGFDIQKFVLNQGWGM